MAASAPWYTYTPTLVPLPLYPWYPIPTTYIHTCIDAFVLFIYLFILLSLCLFILLSLSLLLFSSLLFCLLSLSPCPWQGLPLGRGSRSYLSCVRQCFILFNYYPAVYMYGMYVCIYMYCIVYVYVSSIIHVSNRCMYVHSVVCAVCMRSCVYIVVYMLCCVVQTTCAWCAIVYSLCV